MQLNNIMNFDKLIEMVCADVGIGGSAVDPGNQQGDFYATGDARVPSVLATKKKLFGKKGKKKNKPLMLRRKQGNLW